MLHTDQVVSLAAARRITTAEVLYPGITAVIYPGLIITRHPSRVHILRPPGLPLACSPRMTRAPSGFPWAPHPREQDPRTHARAGTGSEHKPGTRPPAPTSCQPSNLLVHSHMCDLVSHHHLMIMVTSAAYGLRR